MFPGLIPIADIDHRVQMSTGQILQLVKEGGGDVAQERLFKY